MPARWSEAGGECKDGVPWPPFPGSDRSLHTCAEPEACRWAETQAKQIGLFHRETGCTSACCVCSALGVAAQGYSLSDCHSPTGPRSPSPHPPVATRARCSGGSPWVAAAETGALHVRKSAPLGDAGAVGCGRGRAQR
ncbi:hypothetical protein HJG60_011868 [Phyllostomus discolor]|uniref:Uncharacterized protein n=1 Tax=Phyllostomus discolor TaxID=89673 RepID=A0A833ZPJ6_9CHIR|nr:hypothetical protein HJG60_011868 [Phyllostomus discolor]